MNFKKVVAGIISFCFVWTAFAGCSKADENEKSSAVSSENSNSSAESKSDSSGPKENTNPIVTPEGSYSFTLFVDDSNTSDEWMFSYLEKQTGIKVNVQRYPYEVAKEKLKLALNSGTYADCIGGWCLTQNDILTYGVDQKVYIPLEDYFKEYCPQIMEILELPGVKQAMTAPDGHIYSVPYVLNAPLVDFEPFINEAWLKKLGLSLPKTTEEFEEVLKAFKTKDPNGNGKADEIPFSADPNNKHLGYMAGYFGMSLADDGFTMADGKLVFGANTENYKEFIKWMAKLYSQGLIDPELFTQDLSQWKAKGAKDLYGCSIAYGSGDFKEYDNSKAPDFVALPVLSSPTCSNPVFLANTLGSTVFNTQVVITDNAKNPELICRWWDNFFKLENSLQSQWGPIGIKINKTSDGGYKAVPDSELSKEDKEKYEWSNMWAQSLPHFLPLDFKVQQDNPPYDEKKAADKVLQPYLTGPIPTAWVKAEDSATYADISTAIKDYVQQKQAQWITGQANVEEEWDSYCKQLDKLGLQDLIKIRQNSITQ